MHGYGEPTGTDRDSFCKYVTAHTREIDLNSPAYYVKPPSTDAILDFLDLIASSVGKPFERHYHRSFQHRHLTYDANEGRSQFISDLNRILERNGVAFEMTSDERIRRSGPSVLRGLLSSALYRTGDNDTDRLLALASERINSTKLQDRVDALEKLWDALERIKTLEPGTRTCRRLLF